MRELQGKSVVRTETSDKKFVCCIWIDKDHFVTSAGSEVCVWSTKQENPVSMLDTGSSQNVTILASKLSSKGRFSIAAASANMCFFFKLNFSKELKTVLSSSQLKLEAAEKFFDVRITSNTTLSIVYGSIFNITKKSVELTEGLCDLTKKTHN